MADIISCVPCMNAADKETSYARNSLLQRRVLLRTRPTLEDNIKDMLRKHYLPNIGNNCIKVADLGCASGPNTFFAISKLIDTIHEVILQRKSSAAEIHVFLNDLPANDFNNVFRSVPDFYERLKEEKGEKIMRRCFIAAVAGSFYGRLFPTRTMHFIHSSYCLQWLSMVPEGIRNNKGNIYIAKSSPPNVVKAYSQQFEKDFSNFLFSRSEEMVCGGKMLLTVVGRTIVDPTSPDCCCIWELLAQSLLDLVDQGVVQECDVDSFNMPFYYPCQEEVVEIAEREGSFDVDKLQIFEANWDSEHDNYNVCNEEEEEGVFNKYNKKEKSGQSVANTIRAISEPMLTAHFGDTIIPNLFARYAERAARHLSLHQTNCVSLVISMTRK